MRRLRRAAPYIAVAVIMLSLFGIFYLNAITLAQFKTQLANQQKITEQIEHSGDERSSQLQTLNNHIDCVVALLSQPNRSTVRVQDIQNCKLVREPTASNPSQAAPSKLPAKSSGPTANTPTPVSRQPAPTPTPVAKAPAKAEKTPKGLSQLIDKVKELL